VARDARLSEVPHTLTAIDGTLLDALPLLAEATLLNHEKRRRAAHRDELAGRAGGDHRAHLPVSLDD
jgi:hypothetical protein